MDTIPCDLQCQHMLHPCASLSNQRLDHKEHGETSPRQPNFEWYCWWEMTNQASSEKEGAYIVKALTTTRYPFDLAQDAGVVGHLISWVLTLENRLKHPQLVVSHGRQLKACAHLNFPSIVCPSPAALCTCPSRPSGCEQSNEGVQGTLIHIHLPSPRTST